MDFHPNAPHMRLTMQIPRFLLMAGRLLPQGIRSAVNRRLGRSITFRGVYDDWNDASRAASGYDDADLLRRVEAAALEAQANAGAWERDGVVFRTSPVPPPYCDLLERVARSRGNKLCVVDFGGGLGGTCRIVRGHLPADIDVRWHVVEQPHYVVSGRRHFEDARLNFHTSMASALKCVEPDVILMSSVLQYLEDPYTLLREVSESRAPYLVIDRHPCSGQADIITVQVVPKSIYPASYPCWVFDCGRMDEFLGHSFDRLCAWEASDPEIHGQGFRARFVGGTWRRVAK